MINHISYLRLTETPVRCVPSAEVSLKHSVTNKNVDMTKGKVDVRIVEEKVCVSMAVNDQVVENAAVLVYANTMRYDHIANNVMVEQYVNIIGYDLYVEIAAAAADVNTIVFVLLV